MQDSFDRLTAAVQNSQMLRLFCVGMLALALLIPISMISGLVSEIEYWSEPLGVKRRAHVYTPPGYFQGSRRYPVLYLVHGAGDSDDNWTSTGHAHYILDNLIAARRAKPMIIVMPFGHTPERPGGTNILGGVTPG